MDKYKNLAGDSGVVAYEIEPKSIAVRFRNGSVYLYTYQSAGTRNVERMKVLARKGCGLNTFISTSVRKDYASKSRASSPMQKV
jgi:hypothetical protein